MMEDSMRKRIYIYVYDWITLLYSRNWHNIVNQLYSNKKNERHTKTIFKKEKRKYIGKIIAGGGKAEL